MNGKSQSPGTKSVEHPMAEKVSFVLSLLILMGVVSAVLYVWLTPSEQPATFHIEPGIIRENGGRYYLDFRIKNVGDETGQNVTVEGVLPVEGKEDKVSTTFDYIPGHSEEEGVLLFDAHPGGARLRVQSYQKPG